MTTDSAFAALLARKDRQVSQLLGRDQTPSPEPDPVRLALEKHRASMDQAYFKTQANFPAVREPVERGPARSWANDYHVRVGDLSLPASVLLVNLLRADLGPALVAEIAKSTPGLSEAIQRHLGIAPMLS